MTRSVMPLAAVTVPHESGAAAGAVVRPGAGAVVVCCAVSGSGGNVRLLLADVGLLVVLLVGAGEEPGAGDSAQPAISRATALAASRDR
ncbi:MAG: hypothetical protein ACRDQ7_15940 [Haloechinothrix sp.]